MYIVPKPMKPDTFSQYGYSSASQLNALERGYGHDIYPQYPTTYDVPRVIDAANYLKKQGHVLFEGKSNGLGAYEYKGFTVKYYATPGSLKFKNKAVKTFYEAMRDFDAGWQKNLDSVGETISDWLGKLSSVTGIESKTIREAFKMPSATAGLALFLETAAGGRPMDASFKANCSVLSKQVKGLAALAAIYTAVTAAIGGLTVVVPMLLPASVIMAKITLVVAPLGLIAAVSSSILADLSKGKLPSKSTISKINTAAARITGDKPISDDEITAMYREHEKKATKQEQPPPQSRSNKNTAKNLSSAATVSGASVKNTNGQFPVLPLLVGGAAVVAVVAATRNA